MNEDFMPNPQMAASDILLPQFPLPGAFQIALVIHDCQVIDRAVTAIRNIVSRCQVTNLVVLQSNPATQEKDAKEWMEQYLVQNADKVKVRFGEQGFQQMLKTPSVDAVYIIVPTEEQLDYVLYALKADKHVLLKDPISTSYDEFMEQLNCAQRMGKFIQFSTMFVHHHRVKTFMDCVAYEKFGNIESINALLTFSYNDLHNVGVNFPLVAGMGCLRRLGRFCVLISALLLQRVGSRPISAQVKRALVSETGEPYSADCIVHFTQNRVLTFHVAYTLAPTRQVLDVRAHDRYASINDFVIPHPDGLSTYRIYDKEYNPVTGQLEVVRGEAIDVPSGPPQDVMMWRRFCEYSRSVEKGGWTSNPMADTARELTNVAIQTKRILITLDTSFRNGFTKEDLVIEDTDVH